MSLPVLLPITTLLFLYSRITETYVERHNVSKYQIRMLLNPERRSKRKAVSTCQCTSKLVIYNTATSVTSSSSSSNINGHNGLPTSPDAVHIRGSTLLQKFTEHSVIQLRDG